MVSLVKVIVKKIHQIKDVYFLKSSQLFDKTWYLQNNPDVRQTGVDPLLHYYRWGGFEGRDPNPNFDSKWYLENYPDVKATEINPWLHYLRFGLEEGRFPSLNIKEQYKTLQDSDLFDENWYLDHYPQVKKMRVDPLRYYLEFGGFKRQNPGPKFSSGQYLDNYPDVNAARVNPLFHYVAYGKNEGRDLAPIFKSDSWKAKSTMRNSNNLALINQIISIWNHLFLKPVPSTWMSQDKTSKQLRQNPNHVNLSKITKSITFFVTEQPEFEIMKNIAQVAKGRGYDVVFSTDVNQHASIGVYSQHYPKGTNADLSVVMLHDLGQTEWPECPSIEPNHWSEESWSSFDIGILPGRAWSQCWYSVSDLPEANPRLGVFELGWPKADKIFKHRSNFGKEVSLLKKELQLKELPSILYAPSWENDGKLDDFIESLIHLPINLLIKQGYWPIAEENDRISEITKKYQDLSDKGIFIIKPETNILNCLALSSAVVSDESNCLVEGLLFEIPGIAVTDWIIPAPTHWVHPLPPRLPEPPKSAIKTSRIYLRDTVQQVILNKDKLRPINRQYRDHYFSHLGQSSDLIMDTIEAAIKGSFWPIEPLQPKQSDYYGDLLKSA